MHNTSDNSIEALTALRSAKRLTSKQREQWSGHSAALIAANPGTVQPLAWGRPYGQPTTVEVLNFLGLPTN